jgi:hypothetical protein
MLEGGNSVEFEGFQGTDGMGNELLWGYLKNFSCVGGLFSIFR